MFCPDCGCMLQDGCRICPDCGHRVRRASDGALDEEQCARPTSGGGMSPEARSFVAGGVVAILSVMLVCAAFFLEWAPGLLGMEMVSEWPYSGRAELFLNLAPFMTVVLALGALLSILIGRTRLLMVFGAAVFMIALLFGAAASHGVGLYLSAAAGVVMFFSGIRAAMRRWRKGKGARRGWIGMVENSGTRGIGRVAPFLL